MNQNDFLSAFIYIGMIMVLIISGTIIFNPQDCTLTLKDEQKKLKLPLPAGKLLEVLLSKPGEIFARDFLLEEVWDKQGLTGSNGNLNQYISLLRRHLSTLGMDNLIETVPRVGFMINKDIDVEVSIETCTINKVRSVYPVRENFFQISLSLLTLCSAIFFFYSLFFKSNQSEVDIVKSTFNGCNINYLTPFSNYEVQKLNVVVARLLSSHSLECNSNKVVFFDYYKSVSSKGFGRALMSVCQKDQAGLAMKCNNFYYYDLES